LAKSNPEFPGASRMLHLQGILLYANCRNYWNVNEYDIYYSIKVYK
jgi:hypothetical protein